MTNVVSINSEEERYDEASKWLARLDRDLTPEETRQLKAWLTSPENRSTILNMAKLWDEMGTLSRLSSLFPQTAEHQEKASRPLVKRMATIAASILIIVFVGFGYSVVQLPERAYEAASASGHYYQTAIGERSTITLIDGSILTLNTDSSVEVKYTEAHRLLILKKGEIYVNVAKDANRPLSVLANDQLVQAVGTEFNVEITDDQKIELFVTEGEVRVAAISAKVLESELSVPLTPLPKSSLALTAGEVLVIEDAGQDAKNGIVENTTRQIPSEDFEVKLSWRNGNLIFRGEPLEQAVKEVGRYTSVEFIILDDSLRKVRVAGLFKAGDVDSLLSALRENFNIVSQRTDDDKVLLSRMK